MIFWFSSDLFLLRRNGCRRMKRFVFPASNGSAKLDRGFDTSPMVWSLPLVLSMGCQRPAPIVEHIEHMALCLLDLVVHRSMGFYGLLFGHFFGGTFHQKTSNMEEHDLHQKSSFIDSSAKHHQTSTSSHVERAISTIFRAQLDGINSKICWFCWSNSHIYRSSPTLDGWVHI